MESLIKKNNLISMKVPKSFLESFDNWAEEKSKKNKVKISRSLAFNLLGQSLPLLDIEMRVKRKRKKICTLTLNNLKRKK